jgi:hypothetical protein
MIQMSRRRETAIIPPIQTDPFGYDVQISGLANNALTDG